MRSAHPRSRGENGLRKPAAPGEQGSSPLTRGKRGAVCPSMAPVRLIPAHAGKTLPWPRGQPCVDGSSPLTRGKQGFGFCARVDDRLIPAHAGKTRSTATATACRTAHPRSRGENALGITTCRPAPGSSPLTRGKPPMPTGPLRRSRLIPAHAGKTWAGSRTCSRAPAHPRSRGENEEVAQVVWLEVGSSPLTRGKPATTQARAKLCRLIPAHAGKTAFV